MKRKLTTILVSAALALAPFGAMAAPSAQQDNLAPGPAAGVQPAQDIFAGGTTTYVVVGVLAVALIVAAASGGGGNGSNGTNSTSGTVP
jgi:hypothetical protein